MDKKASIVLIAPFLPYPLSSGGKARLLHTLIELNRQYNIELFLFYENESEIKENVCFFEKNSIKYNLYKQGKRHLFSFISFEIPYWFSSWNSQELISDVRTIFRQKKLEFVQIETTQLLYVSKYIPKNIKKAYVAYDISYVSFWRRIYREFNPLKLIIKLIRLLEIYLYEHRYIKDCDVTIAVSDHDQELINKLFKPKKIICIPNGVDTIKPLPKKSTQDIINLGYIGSFEHTPNLTAVNFFIQKIAPKLESKRINYRFFVAGNNKDSVLINLLKKSKLQHPESIINLGFVENTEDFYKRIDIMIAPILSGSGTRLKILESLSYGVPVITTQIGKEGIDISSSFLQSIDHPQNQTLWIETIERLSSVKFSQGDKDNLNSQLQKYIWSDVFSDYHHKISSAH